MLKCPKLIEKCIKLITIWLKSIIKYENYLKITEIDQKCIAKWLKLIQNVWNSQQNDYNRFQKLKFTIQMTELIENV